MRAMSGLPIATLHDQVNSVLCVKDFIELDDVGMTRFLEDLDLAIHSSHVCRFFDATLFQDLYSNLIHWRRVNQYW